MAKELTFQQSFEAVKADFRAAKSSRHVPRLTGVDPMGSGADYHYRSESAYLHILERVRDFERNDYVVQSGINRLVANVMQDGFSVDPATGDAELDRVLKERWDAWTDADSCHSEGQFSFYQIERLVLRSIIRDGDIFALPLKNGTLQLVESHRPRTPRTKKNVVNGILLDDAGKRLQVWFSKEDFGTQGRVSKVADIAPYNFRDEMGNKQVLHCYFPKRFSQRRGLSALSPVTDVVGIHDDTQFAMLVKQQMSSLIVLLEEQSANSMFNGPGLGGPAPGQQQQVQTTSGNIAGIGTGLHYRLAPGNKMTGFAPDIPGPSFFEHTWLLLTFIAINLDIPLQALLLDPTKSNFSSWRGSMDQARIRFREMQADMVYQFHSPVYRWKVRQWIAMDPVIGELVKRSGVDPFRHTWHYPAWGYIDPLVDSQSDQLQQAQFLNSPRRIQAARGRDWDAVCDEIVLDKGKLIERAIIETNRINGLYTDAKLDWRELLGPGLTSMVQVNLQPQNQGQA